MVLLRHSGSAAVFPLPSLRRYVKIVGGMNWTAAVDTACCSAIKIDFRDKPPPKARRDYGEVGLTGELRAVSNAGQRINEAYRLSFILVMPDQEVDEELARKMNLVASKVGGIGRAVINTQSQIRPSGRIFSRM